MSDTTTRDTVTSRLVQSTDGTNIFATGRGNPCKPSLVFVHGYCFSSIVFKKLLEDERLLSCYYLVSYDLRGHGRSDRVTRAEDFTSKLWADDFMAVSRSFGLRSPIYVGWSYGGSIPADLLAHYPSDSICGIISISPGPYPAPRVQHCGANSAESAGDNLLNLQARIGILRACFNYFSTLCTQFQYALVAQFLSLPMDVKHHIAACVHDYTNLNKAGKAGMPICLIWGTGDQILMGEMAAEEIKNHFTDVELCTIPDGSHALVVENAEEVAEALLRFAGRVHGS